MDVIFPFLVFSLIGTMASYFCARSVPAPESRWLFRVLLLAFALRMLTATAFALFPETRIFHDDATGYELHGLRIAAAWSGSGPPSELASVLEQNYGYFYFAAIIYYVFGAFACAVSYASALLGMLTVFLVYRLASRFFHLLVTRRAALMVAFTPSLILWSSMALKDPLMTFLIVLSLSSCVSFKQRASASSFLGTILPVIAIQPIRFYIVYFLGFAILLSLVLERGIRRLTGVSKQLLIGGAVVAMLALVGFSGRAQQGMDYLSFEKVSSFRRGMAASADSGFSADIDVSTPAGAIAFLPVGVAVLLLGPFPWQFTSLRAILAGPETIIWWFMFPSLLRGLRFAFRKRFTEISPLILFSFTLTSAYSLVHGNVGSGFRQRAQIFVFLFIFAAVGQYLKQCRRRGLDERLLLKGEPASDPAAPVTV
jgi:4-amino-4-deoxy-L-arabinose transferase-like glycosyltransferase